MGQSSSNSTTSALSMTPRNHPWMLHPCSVVPVAMCAEDNYFPGLYGSRFSWNVLILDGDNIVAVCSSPIDIPEMKYGWFAEKITSQSAHISSIRQQLLNCNKGHMTAEQTDVNAHAEALSTFTPETPATGRDKEQLVPIMYIMGGIFHCSGHSQPRIPSISNTLFSSQDVHLLASASIDGRVYIRNISEGSPCTN
uniref:Acylamino-acid-releasing enzyme N-terminal domain-containing protein n=1 Tax=Vitis vinifera TaxID=29760 RepID=A5C9N8_VITVI|nr:hypothetical protein VITISV_013405 [Vitis vinifera]